MAKTCDLCLALRPVVYCNADAASLCLSCDAKVHAANKVVHRHPRFLLCHSCKYRAAEVKCLDHRMFMCDVCFRSPHRNCSGHQKHTLTTSFTGCPSAKKFAEFWGFELDKNLYISSEVNMDVPDADSYKHGGCLYQKSIRNCFVLDQILDLKRLQLSDGNYPLQGDKDQKSWKSSSVHHNMTSKRAEDNIVRQLIYLDSDAGNTRSQERESVVDQDLNVHPLHFASSSTTGSPSYTDSFRKGRDQMQNSQLWNMQALGVCEELPYHVDPNTHFVESTFQNF